jgi:hypothetical protein
MCGSGHKRLGTFGLGCGHPTAHTAKGGVEPPNVQRHGTTEEDGREIGPLSRQGAVSDAPGEGVGDDEDNVEDDPREEENDEEDKIGAQAG